MFFITFTMEIKIKLILLIFLFLSLNVSAETEIVDARYCGKPERTASNKIKRNTNLIRQFKKMYPIPPELSYMEFEVDHVIPLDQGGCDSIINLNYLPKSIKSSDNPYAKDRWERKLYPRNY